jgi:DNA invertase Pin-like site-specific DNA recombinase
MEQAEEGYSLAAQNTAIRAACAARGWPSPTIVSDEGISAFTDITEKRPAFARMLDAATGGEYDVVMVHRLDRFARSLLVTLRELQRLEKAGVAFLSVAEGLDFSTPIGRVVLSVLAAFAEYFSRNLGTETRKGLDQKRRAGLHVGAIPWGALRVDGRLVIDPARADDLAYAYELMATHSDYLVAARLNGAGIRPKSGRAFGDNTIRLMRTRHGAWLAGMGEPWASLHEAAAARVPLPRVRSAARTLTLTGLISCRCGGWVRFNSEKHGTRYGTCVRHGRAGWSCAVWKGHSISEVERHARSWLLGLGDTTAGDDRPAGGEGDARRAALIARRARMVELYGDGELTREQYRAERQALALAESRLSVSPERARRIGAGLRLAQAAWDGWAEEARNAYLRGILDTILVGNGRITPVLRGELRGLWPDQCYADTAS